MNIEFDTWTLKEKEAIISLAFFFLMMVLGWYIGSKIEDYLNERNIKYYQASTVSFNANEFNHLMNTDAGYTFVEGWLKAITPVSHPKLKGEYLYIEAKYQTEHEEHRVVTHSDGKRTWTSIETYYVWRTDKTEEKISPEVTYCGVKFGSKMFDLKQCDHKETRVRTGFRKRIVFSTVKKQVKGCIFAYLENETVPFKTEVYEGYTAEKLREYLSSRAPYYIFWTAWLFLTFGAILVFCIAENDWLDTEEDYKNKQNDNNRWKYYGRDW